MEFKRHKVKSIAYYVGGSLMCLLFLVPFLWMFFLSFKDNFGIFGTPFALPETWDFGLYVESFKTANLGRLFLNSLTVTVTSSVVALFLVYISSYVIARLIHKGTKINDTIYFFFIAGTCVPVYAQLMTIYRMAVGIGEFVPFLGVGELGSLFLPYIGLQIAFLTLILVGGLRGVPRDLEEAALIDGCGLFQLMFRIVLPTIMPVFMTAMILNFLGIWNEYPVASILIQKQTSLTIPMATMLFKSSYTADYGGMLRASVMIIIPQLGFFLIFQKQIMEGMATTGLKA